MHVNYLFSDSFCFYNAIVALYFVDMLVIFFSPVCNFSGRYIQCEQSCTKIVRSENAVLEYTVQQDAAVN